jgi:hypothetical protein
MADKLGICTRYLQREVTYAALQLANSANRQGVPTYVIARGDCNRDVSSWDAKVIDERGCRQRWQPHCQHIIWTSVPEMAEVVAAQHCGITTTLLVNWEELRPEHEGVVRELTNVIVPYRCVLRALQAKWYLKNVRLHYMPWIVPAPPCQPNLLRKGLTVHFPLYDSQPSRADQVVFHFMERVLQEFGEARVSVACGHKWSRSSRSLLKRLKRDYNNRLITYAAPDPYERLALFAKADLTVWAPRFESFALIGLASLAMCTPVISWDIQPQTEYLQAWKNSVLVPCETNHNWLGIPEIVSGYPQFEEQLLATLHDRALLAKLKSSANNGLDTRRANFDTAWLNFLRKD